MLNTFQKANILGRAGVQVPACPGNHLPQDPRRPGCTPDVACVDDAGAMQTWLNAIETLFVAYTAARAAKSLRDAEAARHMTLLRHMASSSSRSYA